MKAAEQRDLAWLVVTVGIATLIIGSVRADLFAEEKRVLTKHDVYFLPPPETVVTMSMGYRHTLADILWAHVLVAQGLRLTEKRRFENLLRLYDAINALDPTFRTPYLMADALITFNLVPRVGNIEPTHGNTLPIEDVFKAREIMERGVAARPDDAELWLTLGQFTSFIAPSSYIDDVDPELGEQWRQDGVKYLERAIALGGDSNIGWQALGGASILRQAGELEATVRFYQRAYAVTDDPDLRAEIETHLTNLRVQLSKELIKAEGAQQAALDRELQRNEIHRARDRAFQSLMSAELPFLDRTPAHTIGPPPRPGACAGPRHADETGCATTWRQWSERFADEHTRR